MTAASVEKPLRNPGAVLAWLAIAFAITWLTVISVDVKSTDFNAFYSRALLARGGQPDPSAVAALPDLNTPAFASLFTPLTFVPLRPAFLAWTAVGAVALLATLSLVRERRRISAERLAWFAGACGILAPGRMIWSEGQVTWILLYLVTRAWLSAGSTASGFWLGAAIAIKPPLALVALLLPWRVGATAAISSASVVAIHIALGGRSPWEEWLGDVARVNWLSTPTNASLWGLAARLQGGGAWSPIGLRDLRPEWIFAILVMAGGLAWHVKKQTHDDRRWVLAILWSVLISPLGWIHYLTLTLGPIAALWRPTWAFRASAAMFVFPIVFVSVVALRYLHSNIVASMSISAVLVAWLVISRDRST